MCDFKSNRILYSPLYVPVNFDSSSEDEEQNGRERYRLRPRNLFNSGVSIRKHAMLRDDSDSDENEKDDKDDEDVFFFLQSEDEDDDDLLDMDEIPEGGVEKKRSSYSGIRGPKADAKALSLVTNCPVSVKWLVDNFEYCPGRSLPRGFVYDQYVLLCNENLLEPVNAASFGKLIRSVFPGLKTRRLGTRGNSKYHYNGVYLKQLSPLMVILNLIKTQQGLSYDGNGKRGRRVRRCFEGMPGRNGGSENFRSRDPDEFMDCSPDEYLGKRPEMDQPFAQLQIDHTAIPATLDPASVYVFESIYHSHCQMILSHFEKFDLKQVTEEWKRFWRLKCNIPEEGNGVIKYREVMSKATLFKVCSLESTQRFMMSMDLSTYQYVIDILFPCLSKGMPITMVNGMRNFIKNIDFVFFKILDGYPKRILEIKLRCLRSLLSMWNDYSRLNRMLKSAVSTIRNEDNIQAMHSELCRSINFQDIENQVSLYQKSSEAFVQDNLILEFRLNLDYEQNASYSIKCWIHWAEQVAQKLIEESGRQVVEGEVSKQIDPFFIWKKASDRILGAIVKGNAVSFGVFKGFLGWCDYLIKHVSKLTMAHSEGFMYPIFYYETTLEESELKIPEPAPTSYRPGVSQQNGSGNDSGIGSSYCTDGSMAQIHSTSETEQARQPDSDRQPNTTARPDNVQVYYFDTTALTNDQLMEFIESSNSSTTGLAHIPPVNPGGIKAHPSGRGLTSSASSSPS